MEKANFYVAGPVFVVEGEPDNPVTFTGTRELEGWWSGVTLHSTDRAANKLEHAVISYGGNDHGRLGTTGNCLHCNNRPSNLLLHGRRGDVQIALENVTFSHSSAHGLFADDEVVFSNCTDVTFEDNATDWASNNTSGEENIANTCSL